MRHVVSVKRPCVRCKVTRDDIISGQTAGGRSLSDKKTVRKLLESPRDNVPIVKNENEVAEEEEKECSGVIEVVFVFRLAMFSRKFYEIAQAKRD